VDVVFVDWHQTLSTSLFWEHGHGCRLPPATLARVSTYVFTQPQLVRHWMLGAVVAEDVCALAAGYFGVGADDVLADLEQSCRRMELCDPAVVDTLRLISERGIKVVLATDNMDTFRRWTIPALRLDSVFDDVLTSDACGALKTDLFDRRSPFFSPWLAGRGIAPSDAVLIDDTRVAAAEAIGINVRLIEDPSNLATTLANLARTTF
jgi:hypothetical protein